jgi:hypothetical protein
VDGHGVLGGRVADGGGVAVELAGLDVVRRLTTDEEAVVADDGVGGEGGALGVSTRASGEPARTLVGCGSQTHLEDVGDGAGVDRGLLVDGSEDGGLLRLGGVEGGVEVELEAVGELVLELNLGAEEVRGGPGLTR